MQDTNKGQDYEPQDFAEFFDFEERAKVTPERKTIYIVPCGLDARVLEPEVHGVPLPPVAAVAHFLTAFTGLPHKVLPALPIVPWPEAKKKKGSGGGEAPPKFLAVRTSKDALVRVRTIKPEGLPLALHCHDVLDALLEELPGDAFAIMGLTAYDLHEDGQCVGGRAFGGSRIAVVSFARYHPHFLDWAPDWPALTGHKGSALREAARAASAAVPPPKSPQALSTWWLYRTGTTAMHELGHCLGLDHCTYYSCFMGECEGQAPYACPVCLRKLLCAVSPTSECSDPAPAVRHYSALQKFCLAQKQSPSWAAFGAWCGGRLEALGGEGATASGSSAGAATSASSSASASASGGGGGGGMGGGGGAWELPPP